MKKNYFILLCFALLFLSHQSYGQITQDANFTVNSTLVSTIPAVTVPAGTNRVLLISFARGISITSPTGVTFGAINAIPLAQFTTGPSAEIWGVPLGTGGIVGPSAVTLTGAGNSYWDITAVSFQNVDQTTIGFNPQFATDNSGALTTSTLSYPSSATSNNLIVDVIGLGSTDNIFMPNPPPHTTIGVGRATAVGSAPVTGAAVSLNWDWVNGAEYTQAAVELIAFVPPIVGSPGGGASIPTLSEWGLIILTLLLLIGVGLLHLVVPQTQIQSTKTPNQSPIGFSRPSLPFNLVRFMAIIPMVALGFVFLFGMALAFFEYQLTTADLIGSLVSIPLVSYLLLLLSISYE